MKKILLTLCVLLGTVGAWATDVVISDRTNTLDGDQNVVTTTNEHKYGTYSNAAGGNSFITNEASGMAGVAVEADGEFIRAAYFPNQSYLHVIAFNPSDTEEHTITISAPDGYVITAYSITAISTSMNRKFTVTPDGDEKAENNVSAPGLTTFNKSGLNSQTATLTIQAANDATGNFLCFPLFSVTVMSASAKTVNVTYSLYESDGTTLVNSIEKTQEANSELEVPASLTSSTYFDYSIDGTIGEEDCVIKVIRTPKDGIVYPISKLSNNKAYRIVVPRGTYTVVDGKLANTVKSSEYEVNYFALINYENNYYMWSVEENKFAAGDAATLTDTPVAITFAESTLPSYLIKSGSKTLNATSGFATGAGFDGWSSADDGNRCVIYEAEDFDPTTALDVLDEYFHPSYTVTYIVKDAQSNVLFTSEPVGTTKGATITTLPEEYQMAGFYTYNEVNVSITTAGNTKVEFTATPVEKPIVQYTADASNPYYYNLNIRSKYLVYNSEAAGEVTLQDASEPFNPNASWAFIGEPYAGFKVINKTKGTDNFLTYTSVVPGSNHGNNNIQFVATEEFNDQYWLLDKNSGGFVLRMKENKDIYFHHDNGKNFLRTCSVDEWSGVHNDVGSTIVASTDEDVLFALYDALSSNLYGDAVGLYHSTSESMTTEDINNSIAEVAEVIQGQKTSDYGDAYKALLEIEKNIAIVAPKPGFYRVKNVFTDGYLKATEATGFSSDVNAVFADAGIDDPATIVELREIDGKLYMINQGAFFNWVIADKSYGSGKAWVAANQDKYVNWLPGSAPGQIAFAICYGNGTGGYASYLLQGIYTANAEGVVVGGTNPAADEAQWVFEEATGVELQLVEVDDYGYATTCLPFAVNKIEGAKPYTVTVKDGWAVLEEVEGDQIPAGLPVVLVGENSDVAICTIGDADAANPSDENVLKGIYLKAIVNGYVLSVSVDVENNDVVGFYKMNSETALSANHAYIPYETVHPDNAEGVKGFALNLGLQDAIERLVSENADGTTYNLAGQRVLKAVKGIFIKNGKKVVK